MLRGFYESWCLCGLSAKLTNDDFIIRAKGVHGDKYDYSMVDYKGYHVKVAIICPVHGVFWQLPGSHLKGCGCPICAKSKLGTSFEDLSGRVFGRLKVLERADDHVSPSGQHQTMWRCECRCGSVVTVRAASLKNHSIESCGCLRRERASISNFKDLTGRQFGSMYVVKRVDDYVSPGNKKHRRVRYLCRCMSCGREKIVVGESLSSGKVVSCGNAGCRQNLSKIDMSGKYVGWLHVLYEFVSDKYTSPHWVCECKCGRKTIVSTGNLRNGTSRSCGCRHRSHLEDDVFCYFEQHGLLEWFEFIDDMPNNSNFFVYQKQFDDCVGVNGRCLRFDFALYVNSKLYCLIECQGRQHYEPVDCFGGDDSFLIQKSNDELKCNYALKNSVLLINVPYTVRSFDKLLFYLDEYLVDVL